MKKAILVISVFLLTILVWDCDTNEPQQISDEFSDEDVKSAVYSGPKYPSDFFQEDLTNVILNFIRESDILTFTEPATDDYYSALDWVNIRLGELSLDTNKLVYGQLNEKYFEFTWTPDPPSNYPPYFFRVHKSSYFEGVEFGRQDENFYQIVDLGNVNYRPFTLQFIKDFFDQLWFYKHYNMSGAVVLKRTITENTSSYKYSIYFTNTIFGDYGMRDKIRLFKGEFELNKSNGSSLINYTLIKEVLGNSN